MTDVEWRRAWRLETPMEQEMQQETEQETKERMRGVSHLSLPRSSRLASPHLPPPRLAPVTPPRLTNSLSDIAEELARSGMALARS
jgi:hypothetical protein